MAQDIQYDDEFRTEWGPDGDIKTVSGIEQVVQSAITSAVEEAGLQLNTFTAEDIEEKRGDFEQAIRRNDQTQPPVSVEITDIDYDEQTVDFVASTARATTEITTE